MKTAGSCTTLFALIVTLLLTVSRGQSARAQTKEKPSITGAWQWLGRLDPITGEIQEAGRGRLLLTEVYACGVYGSMDRPSPKGEEPTIEEKALLFRTMSGPSCVSHIMTKRSKGWNWKIQHLVAANPAIEGSNWERVHWVNGDVMYGQTIRNDGSRSRADVYLRRSGLGTSSFAGAWQLISDDWDGIMVMTDSQYRYVMARKDRPPVKTRISELSNADAATLYNTFDAQGGSYVLSGSKMTWRPEIAKDPREQNSEIQVEFTFEDQTLIIQRGQNKLAWKRLE